MEIIGIMCLDLIRRFYPTKHLQRVNAPQQIRSERCNGGAAVPVLCKDCPENAICYGLNLITPVAGYWRSSNISINFIQCPNPAACLKGNMTLPTGLCSEGY